MKRLIDDLYYLFFPKKGEDINKQQVDDPVWFKTLILILIGLMCAVLAFGI